MSSKPSKRIFYYLALEELARVRQDLSDKINEKVRDLYDTETYEDFKKNFKQKTKQIQKMIKVVEEATSKLKYD